MSIVTFLGKIFTGKRSEPVLPTPTQPVEVKIDDCLMSSYNPDPYKADPIYIYDIKQVARFADGNDVYVGRIDTNLSPEYIFFAIPKDIKLINTTLMNEAEVTKHQHIAKAIVSCWDEKKENKETIFFDTYFIGAYNPTTGYFEPHEQGSEYASCCGDIIWKMIEEDRVSQKNCKSQYKIDKKIQNRIDKKIQYRFSKNCKKYLQFLEFILSHFLLSNSSNLSFIR